MKLEAVDLNLLVALGHLLEHRSVTAAARETGVTQSTMSHSLSRLRTCFDDPLLLRVGRTMVLTERAETMRPAVKAALAGARDVFNADAQRPLEAGFEMKVAAADYVLPTLIVPLLGILNERAPSIDLRLTSPSMRTVTEGGEGRLDLTLMGMPGRAVQLPAPVRKLIESSPSEILYEERFEVCMRVGHPRGDGPMTLAEFCDLPQLLVSPQGEPTGFIDRMLGERGLRRRVQCTVSSFTGAVEVVRGSDLVCTFPSRFVRSLSTPLWHSEPPLQTPPMKVAMLWHARLEHHRRHQFVRQLIREIAGG